MTLKIIENKKIRVNKRNFNEFLERFHNIQKNFKIDCEAVHADFFSSESTVVIRHRKPAKESIYYAEVYKEQDETAYFFGLARDNVIATSNYLSQESHIVPILVATLHHDDSSKSNIVFASDGEEFNNVILLRIDCSELNEIELDVLKNKNKISKLNGGKGFINFGPIGDFNTLKNFRNFISNVRFENENLLYVKIIEVSIPDNFHALRPDSSIIKDRFYNHNLISDDSEDVIDLNELDTLKESGGDVPDIFTDSYLDDINSNGYDSLSEGIGFRKEDFASEGIGFRKGDFASEGIGFRKEDFASEGIGFRKGDFASYDIVSKGNDSSASNPDLYRIYHFDDDALFIEMSIWRNEFFEYLKIFEVFDKSYPSDLDFIEILDIGDDLLSITMIFLISIDCDIEIIKGFFNLNGFVEKIN